MKSYEESNDENDLEDFAEVQLEASHCFPSIGFASIKLSRW